jgi:CRISPR system Cascade subunit CasD
MTTLLLRLAGPLQAWGSRSRHVKRTTENAPTKSGVLGLLAGAEGRPRDADLSDLAALRFGVRIDQPGLHIRDFHKAENADSGRVMPLSERYYLADAVFLAGVEGEEELVRRLHAAVGAPHFLPYLGRRSCPPSRPLLFEGSLTDRPLEDALRETPWQASAWYVRQAEWEAAATGGQSGPDDLDLLLDCPPGEEPDFQLRDVPVTFSPSHRQYGVRGVRIGRSDPPPRNLTGRDLTPPHDATGHLRQVPPTASAATEQDARAADAVQAAAKSATDAS